MISMPRASLASEYSVLSLVDWVAGGERGAYLVGERDGEVPLETAGLQG
jgi:hypothetical protein